MASKNRRPSLVSTARDIGFIATGVPLCAVAPACVALCPLLLRHRLRTEIFAGSAALAGVVAVVVPLLLLIALSPGLTAVQRWRFSALAGLRLDRTGGAGAAGGARGIRAWLTREDTWRQLAYHLVAGLVLVAAGLAAFASLALGVALSLTFLWISTRNGAHPVQVRIELTVAGIALVSLAPWTIRWARRAEVRVGANLLGASRAERLLATVTESRSGLLAAVDAERRRIERDLHDGAQARMVSLAMNLGLARATRPGLSEDAKTIIAEAQVEAVKAIEELRHLVRGLHPAVLDDLGLDAALSALAARSPVPVSLHVSIQERASPTIEAVAYFVVSEALTNVSKHSRASRAVVVVDRVASTLRVVVTDDGTGGADPSQGTGITGLRQRVASVDGMIRFDSPSGGPTTILVELPCES